MKHMLCGKRKGILHRAFLILQKALKGKSMELCKELLKKEVGIYCIQEVKWRGMGSKFVGSLGRRFKLW